MADAFLMGNGGGEKELVIQEITVSGTYTVPADVAEILVWMCGGGSGGGSERNSNGNYSGFWSGISGSTRLIKLNVTPGQQFPVVIGAGVTGRTGGDTSFGSYVALGGQLWSPGDLAISGAPAFAQGRLIVGTAGSIDKSYGYNNPPSVFGGESGLTGVSGMDLGGGQKGYCPLNGQVYCGGGVAIGLNDNGGNTSDAGSWSFGAVGPAEGGGPYVPAMTVTVTVTPPVTIGVSMSGTPVKASKYGAGGIGIWKPYGYTITGLGILDDSANLSGANGAVIVGYYI